ncbi:hypothetical protein ACIPVB_02490 [Microbacterium sp. NPDC090007]|uniref:hypothetical protein n=1 Tax=Microbacterium sp. NPDC090007 TaxID=3364204 RepID=UPI0037F17A0D
MPIDAASALADLLENWRLVPAGYTSDSVRGNSDPATDVRFWHEQARAFELAKEVERTLSMLEQNGRRTGHFRAYLPAIYGAIGGWTVPFRTAESHDRNILEESAIHSLRSLSDVLHALGSVDADTDEYRHSVSDAIEYVRSLLTDYPDLDQRSRGYLLALATELEHALNDVDVFGTALVRKLSTELAGVLFGQAVRDAKTDRSRARRFCEAATKLFWIGAGAGAAKAAEIGANEIANQLGMIGD